MESFESHEVASLFPMMDDQRLSELAENIKSEGLRHPIVIFEGKILDGRNRYKACLMTGIEPKFTTFDGGNPWEYVWSSNAERRDITTDQRYLIWRKKSEESKTWEAMMQAVQDDANRKRSEATKAQPRNEDGQFETTGSGTNSTTTRHEHKTRQAKAEASKTNQGAVARGDLVYDKRPDLADKVISGEMNMACAIREIKRDEIIQKLESIETKKAKELDGLFDVIIIDPPWPMEKIERDERPNQTEFDYPTMTEEALAALHIPAASDCHVWLWTTHRFMRMALRLLEAWGLKYVCTFVWHKPGGFQPHELPQYNCEFAIYARKGKPRFIDFKKFFTCFEAPRGRHSEKPEEFYETVRRVTRGRRLDMFARRENEGFKPWGNEI